MEFEWNFEERLSFYMVFARVCIILRDLEDVVSMPVFVPASGEIFAGVESGKDGLPRCNLSPIRDVRILPGQAFSSSGVISSEDLFAGKDGQIATIRRVPFQER